MIRDILQLKRELNDCQCKLLDIQKENTRNSEELQVEFNQLKECYRHSELECKNRINKLNEVLNESQQEQQCQWLRWNKDNEERWQKSVLENEKLTETFFLLMR